MVKISVRAIARSIAEPLRSQWLTHMFLVGAATRGRADLAPKFHIVVAPTGGGNIGDEAMVDSFLECVEGDVLLVARSRSAFPRHARMARVNILEAGDLLHRGRFPRTALDARRLRKSWSRAASLSVVGADIMDGGYNWQDSVARANIARWAAEDGLDARILGFSWKSNADPRAVAAVKRASRAGVRLLARDPHSTKRLHDDGVAEVELVTDTVFSSFEHSAIDLARLGICNGRRPIVLLNVSALVGRSVNQTVEAATTVSWLVAQGFHVILLPHVMRDARDDLEEAQAVANALALESASHVSLVDRLLTPAEVRKIASYASLAVTGRMHLAVIALSQGVPSVVVATQGKVSGLMELFGIEDLVVEPEEIGLGALQRSVEDAVSNLSMYRDRVDSALPSVVAKSRQNFRGLIQIDNSSSKGD